MTSIWSVGSLLFAISGIAGFGVSKFVRNRKLKNDIILTLWGFAGGALFTTVLAVLAGVAQ